MTRIRKKVLTQTFLLGIIVTFAVVIVDSLGGLQALEHYGYDERVKRFQFFAPPPTDKIVHANIDDETLQLVGQWPWDRDLFAEIISELRSLGAKVVTMDIIFQEPQNLVWRPKSNVGFEQSQADVVPRPSIGEAAGSDIVAIDRDAILAREFAQVRIPVLGVIADAAPIPSREYLRIYAMLHDNLELSIDQVVARFRDPSSATISSSTQPKQDVQGVSDTRYLIARKYAMRDRIFELKAKNPQITVEQAAAILIPHTLFDANSAFNLKSPVSRTFSEQFIHATSVSHMFAHLAATPPEPHDHFLLTDMSKPPIASFTAACRYVGTVSSFPDPDGVVRSIPLWTHYKGKLFPQLGLAAALAMLDVDVHQIRFQKNGFVIPAPDGTERFVPTQTNKRIGLPGDKYPGYFFDIPWVGAPDNYTTMYDPHHIEPTQQISVTAIWKLYQIENRIRTNNAIADDALARLLDISSDANDIFEFKKAQTKFRSDDVDARTPYIRKALEIARENGLLRPHKPATTQAEVLEENMVTSATALQAILANNELHKAEAKERRKALQDEVKDKTVLIGWTASAIIADFVPTSLHSGRTPGATVHGTIFNSIMTRHFWHRTPEWLSSFVAILAGLLAAACVAALPAVPAFLASLGLLALYVIINCLIVFDYGGYLLGLAGPVVAIAVVWSIGTVFRFVIESRELKRITESFQNRVDPALVKYVIENPDKVTLTGESRELSVVFTDLAGFTSLSERLDPVATVAMLNKYMGQMVPAIRKNHGYVNKFLGDGIMFFFGAPAESENHALEAVVTVIEMQKLLKDFNKELVEQGLPELKMRAGISTGHMTVGDAGSIDTNNRSFDYTVLGDMVNFAARLESANKATGTLMLMTERTIELMGPSILARPIGRLVVVGKTQGVMVWEPLGLMSEATEKQLTLASATKKIVEAFQAADFVGCIKAVDEMDAALGVTATAELYRALCEKFIVEPPPTPFDGCITLSAK